MGYFRQFEEWDPISDTVPESEFGELSGVVRRARSMLISRTLVELRVAAEEIDWWIEDYFQTLKEMEISRLRKLAEQSNASTTVTAPEEQHALTYFSRDNSDGSLVLLPEMEAVLDIPNEDSMTEVEVLRQCIDWNSQVEIPSFLNGKPFEYFAILALWLVADAIRWIQWSGDPVTMLARAHDVLAPSAAELSGVGSRKSLDLPMQSVLDGLPALVEQLQVALKQVAPLGITEASIRLSLAAAYAMRAMDAVGQAEAFVRLERLSQDHNSSRLVQMDSLNAHRHAGNRAARDLVINKWLQNPSAFPSAEKASVFFTDWLARQGYQFEHRTVRDWILKYAKKAGVRFR